MLAPQISGESHSEVLSRIGTALLQVKNARLLSLQDLADKLRKSDDQVARYIAGDMEMGAVAWLRACEAWPEIEDRLAETEAERALKGRQLDLSVDAPVRRKAA